MSGPAPTLPDHRLRLTTRFGDFDADLRNLVTFPAGLPGFEQCRRFVVLSSVQAAPLQCLHAVSGPQASFLALDPRLILPEYHCELDPADAERLRVCGGGDHLLWLALLSLDERGVAFANLRAPVVINPAVMVGFQVIPHHTDYSLRHPVAIG